MTADAAGDGAGDAAALPATLPAAIRVAASRWPDRIAWRFDPGGQLTFADVDRLTAGYAAVLRERGVQAGDRVALLIRNEVAFPLTWLALARLGAAASPRSRCRGTGRPRGTCPTPPPSVSSRNS